MSLAKQQQQSQQKVFTRRLAMLAGLKAVLVGTLAGRLYYLQVIEGEKYKLLSDENRINHRILFPPRGLIVDRFGSTLAVQLLSAGAESWRGAIVDALARITGAESIVERSDVEVRALEQHGRLVEARGAGVVAGHGHRGHRGADRVHGVETVHERRRAVVVLELGEHVREQHAHAPLAFGLAT